MSDFIIKTVSFLSGKVLIGKVKDNGDWEDALFITVTQHPETGERRASFRPVAPGRATAGRGAPPPAGPPASSCG